MTPMPTYPEYAMTTERIVIAVASGIPRRRSLRLEEARLPAVDSRNTPATIQAPVSTTAEPSRSPVTPARSRRR